ncbi:MAG: DUF2059 domain-containing protein, partial [Flavobacteriaceae bacterium]
MKKSLFIFFLFSTPLIAQSSNSYQTTLDQMIQVSGTAKVFKASIDQMKSQLKTQMPEISEAKWIDIETYIEASFSQLLDQLTPVYQKHLTEEELKHIVDFYQTDAGKIFAEKAPLIAQESMLIGQKWGMQLG